VLVNQPRGEDFSVTVPFVILNFRPPHRLFETRGTAGEVARGAFGRFGSEASDLEIRIENRNAGAKSTYEYLADITRTSTWLISSEAAEPREPFADLHSDRLTG
jgi:hypothetical protein